MPLIPLRPLQDRVIVKRTEVGEKMIGSFLVPDVAKEKPQEGIVLAVGEGYITAAGLIPIGVEEGDTVIFGKYAGNEVELEVDGQPASLLILKADELMAVRTI